MELAQEHRHQGWRRNRPGEVDDGLGEVGEQRQPADRHAERDPGQGGDHPAEQHAADARQQVADRIGGKPQVAGRPGEPLVVHRRHDRRRRQEERAVRRLGA